MLARLKSEWRLKLALFAGINAVFWAGYQVLGRCAFLPLREVPRTWLDDAVTFQPSVWSWVYLSQFLGTGFLPLLLTTRESIRRYVVALAVMCAVSFTVFLLFPARGPRPAEVGGDLAMRWIALLDGPLNALPSLHAAFLVCMARLAGRMFGGRALSVAVIWGGAILFSTLATKQHYALDLLAGGALGAVADFLAWRGASAAAMMRVSRGVASHAGER